MNLSTNFSPDEWKILADTPVVVGKAMIAASPSGMLGAAEEVMTLSNSLKELTKKQTANPFLNELGSQLQNKVNVTKDIGNTLTAELRSLIKKPATNDPKALAIEACNNASSIMDKADPQDSMAYKQFVVSVAQKVAESSREGAMNFSNQKVSPQEQQFLTEIKSAIHVMQ
ncbi:hypothetical protein [Tengunoibacter tsumagoiensis]|uniref:Uncharacterized protein n=1 Tax=Tengunoibacter tsumagoiensis TaxID=2014871 RepID=A0A402A9R7_9CHLR|nr:hypothetical protein [Tengunoibacter tsumagoiensis]GCE15917.1 hypothetical protein KTT_57760 [Tengunoibacter tsumagoiensis]